MALQRNHKRLLQKELILTAIFVILGLFIIFVFSQTGWGCTIDTPGGCVPTSEVEEFLITLGNVLYVLTLIVMPLVILITTIYSLLVLRKLKK